MCFQTGSQLSILQEKKKTFPHEEISLEMSKNVKLKHTHFYSSWSDTCAFPWLKLLVYTRQVQVCVQAPRGKPPSLQENTLSFQAPVRLQIVISALGSGKDCIRVEKWVPLALWHFSSCERDAAERKGSSQSCPYGSGEPHGRDGE